MDDSHRQAFLAAGTTNLAWDRAEQQIAAVLGLALEPGEELGNDWVIDVDAEMLQKCQSLVASQPQPMVLVVLMAGLRGSYHLKGVHDLVVDITLLALAAWRAGVRTFDMRDLLRDSAHAFRYGVRPADTGLVLKLCDDSELAPRTDSEDFRRYWFDALAKLKDPKVGEFCRQLLQDDRDRWTDHRVVDALQIIGKRWEKKDVELFKLYEQNHPQAEVRQAARRILVRKSAT